MFDRAQKGYCYEDPNYSIDKTPLNRDELKSLSFVASLMDQFKKVDIFETYQGAVEKIVNAVNIRRMQKITRSSTSSTLKNPPHRRH